MEILSRELTDDELASSNSDDEHILFQQSVPQKQAVPSKPSPDFEWDDSAIITCFQQSIASHNDKKLSIDWLPPSAQSVDLSALDGWEPAKMPLPQWFANELNVATTTTSDTTASTS